MMRGASLPVEQAALAIMDILFATDFMDEHPEMLDAAIEKRLKGTPMIATLGPLQSALIFDPLEALRSFQAPALILHGEDDELVLPVHAEILAGAIPNGTMQVTRRTAVMRWSWNNRRQLSLRSAEFRIGVVAPLDPLSSRSAGGDVPQGQRGVRTRITKHSVIAAPRRGNLAVLATTVQVTARFPRQARV